MHELSITRGIVAICDEQARGRRVTRVRLHIGKLSGVEVEAVRFCFDLCAEGTALEGAALDVDHIDGRGRCQECDEIVPLDTLLAICPCERRARVTLEAGDELLIKSMEVS